MNLNKKRRYGLFRELHSPAAVVVKMCNLLLKVFSQSERLINVYASGCGEAVSLNGEEREVG